MRTSFSSSFSRATVNALAGRRPMARVICSPRSESTWFSSAMIRRTTPLL
ncbi:Uncharacterised protein [Bordetella pertussis]|nr:Uncharacterised protein [Bordetella pertussis]